MKALRTRSGGAMPRTATSDPRRPRGPGFTFAVVAVALFALVGALSLTARQSSPPTIAEFAPQAVEQITDSGEGAAAAGGARASEEAAASGADAVDPAGQTINVARARQCIGDPPRQIEDPQSPPCVAYWEGDNGGATYKGVTRDEIRVVLPWYNGHVLNPSSRGGALVTRLQSFFNKRFELYGRRLVFLPGAVPWNCSRQKAEAVRADEELKVFASTSVNDFALACYHDELARRGILSAVPLAVFSEAEMSAAAPYLWEYGMSTDREIASLGDWTCARLAGGRSIHAGGAEANRPRRFGLVLFHHSTARRETWLDPVRRQLAACDVTLAEEVVDLVAENWPTDNASAKYPNTILRMRSAEVTSVIYLGVMHDMAPLSENATNQGYFPEWLHADYFGWNDPWRSGAVHKTHQDHVIGITSWPRWVRPENSPGMWALREADPDFVYSDTTAEQWDLMTHYKSLLLLVSGIQLAGPYLTPQAFERGLHRARFPNPPHPTRPGAVGFGDGSHSMTKDFAENWMSTTARSPYKAYPQGGAYCYVDHGDRRAPGRWPTGDVFYQGACDSGA